MRKDARLFLVVGSGGVEARRREWCGRDLTDETFTQKVHRLD